jgi:EAL domain-containing protein (putative c-di-GMP-specific phosphodiesterase class I)
MTALIEAAAFDAHQASSGWRTQFRPTAVSGAQPLQTAADQDLRYQPILDVKHGGTAGYQVQCRGRRPATDDDGTDTAATVAASLWIRATLPAGTFLSIPLPAECATAAPVRAALAEAPTLNGVVLDIIGSEGANYAELDAVAASYRSAGALISVGGDGAAQPELTSIGRLKPAIIRLGREWVRDIEQLPAKRSTIEVIGQLAQQLRAEILCEGVTTEGELRTLAALGVPLAQGPFIGSARRLWSGIHARAQAALP